MRTLSKELKQGTRVTELPVEGVWVNHPAVLITTRKPFFAHGEMRESIKIFMLHGQPVISVPLDLLTSKLKATADQVLTANRTGMLKVEFEVFHVEPEEQDPRLLCDFELCSTKRKWRTLVV